jgi:DNA-binding transcriptional LysR family regulator
MSDLDRLIRFSVVAEELSFSQAARRLHVDQPWLSRQVQQLELQLGFALFVRSTRKVALTREGEELFQHTRELTRVADQCRQASREMSRSHNLELAIGVNPYTFWLPERTRLFEAFRVRHPRVSLEVVSNYTPRLISKLRKRLIDVALVGPPFDFSDLESLIIHSSPISLLVPPEDPLAQCESIAMEDLAGRQIPTVKPELNATVHDRLYGPIFAAGAIPLIVPEGDAAIPFYAANQRLPMICVGERHLHQGAIADFVQVQFKGKPPLVQYALVRRREPARGLLDHFWTAAARQMDDASGSEVTRLIPRKRTAIAAGATDEPLVALAAGSAS